MIYARNGVEVENEQWEDNRTYLLDLSTVARKLTVEVLPENTKGEELGPVIVEVTEDEQHVFLPDILTGQLLRPGFSSKAYVTPITGFRVRIPNKVEVGEFNLEKSLPAIIDFTLYG